MPSSEGSPPNSDHAQPLEAAETQTEKDSSLSGCPRKYMQELRSSGQLAQRPACQYLRCLGRSGRGIFDLSCWIARSQAGKSRDPELHNAWGKSGFGKVSWSHWESTETEARHLRQSFDVTIGRIQVALCSICAPLPSYGYGMSGILNFQGFQTRVNAK